MLNRSKINLLIVVIIQQKIPSEFQFDGKKYNNFIIVDLFESDYLQILIQQYSLY